MTEQRARPWLIACALVFAACSGTPGGEDAGVDAGTGQDAGATEDAGQGEDAGPCAEGCSPQTVCDPDAGVCVGCLQDTDCPAATPICDEATATCLACLGDADCQSPTPICDTAVPGNRCVECLDEGHCADAGLLCDPPSRTCVQQGETCDTVAPLTVMPDGTTSFSVTTESARNDDFGSCGDATPNGNAELVYHLKLSQPQDVEITAASAMGSLADPVVYVRAGSCGAGPTLGCEDRPAPTDGGTASEKLVLRNVAPGDYFLFLETFRELAGVLEVTVTLLPPSAPPQNETCATAEVLMLTDGGITFTADTSIAKDDLTPLCNPAGGSPELVYQLAVTEEQQLYIQATGGPGVKPVLYLSSDPCDPDALLGCEDVRPMGPPEENRLVILSAQPGNYYLFVEADGSGAAGPIDVSVSSLPPVTNESCQAPKTLFVPARSSTTFQVDTASALNDEEGSCAGNLNPGVYQEFVYKLTLTEKQDVDIDVVRAPGSTADAVVYVRETACTGGNEIWCQDWGSSAENVRLYGLAPGDYFIFIETYSTYSGAMDVTVTLKDPVIGEACPAPTVVTFPTGMNTVTYQVDTTSASDDDYGTCSGYGGDFVYEVTLTSTKTITLTATATVDPNTDPVVWARDAPCWSGAELACEDTIGPTDTIVLGNKPAGTYYLFVETWGPYVGQLDVTIEVTP